MGCLCFRVSDFHSIPSPVLRKQLTRNRKTTCSGLMCLGSRAIANKALQFSCQRSEGLGSRLRLYFAIYWPKCLITIYWPMSEEAQHASQFTDSACPFLYWSQCKKGTLSQHSVTHVVTPLWPMCLITIC